MLVIINAGTVVELVNIILNCCIIYVADVILTFAEPPLYTNDLEVPFIVSAFA